MLSWRQLTAACRNVTILLLPANCVRQIFTIFTMALLVVVAVAMVLVAVVVVVVVVAVLVVVVAVVVVVVAVVIVVVAVVMVVVAVVVVVVVVLVEVGVVVIIEVVNVGTRICKYVVSYLSSLLVCCTRGTDGWLDELLQPFRPVVLPEVCRRTGFGATEPICPVP